jgi:hypothetical protein
LGTADETQRVRSAVDTTSVFRQTSLFKWASQFGSCQGGCSKEIAVREPWLLLEDTEHEPPSQRTKVEGGGTAKATAALGALPYVSPMPRFTTPLRFKATTLRIEINHQILCWHFGTQNAFATLQFSCGENGIGAKSHEITTRLDADGRCWEPGNGGRCGCFYS